MSPGWACSPPATATAGPVEIAGGEPGGLDGVVEGVDVVVGGGGDRHRASLPVVGHPLLGDGGHLVGELAAADPVVSLVGVEGGGVGVAELEGGGRFPRLGEPVDASRVRRVGRWRTARRTARPARRLAAGGGHRPGRAATAAARPAGPGQPGTGCRSSPLRPRSPWSPPATATGHRAAGRVLTIRGAAWRRCRWPSRSPGPTRTRRGRWGRPRTPGAGGRRDPRPRPAARWSCPPPPARRPTPARRCRPRRRRRRPGAGRARSGPRWLTGPARRLGRPWPR